MQVGTVMCTSRVRGVGCPDSKTPDRFTWLGQSMIEVKSLTILIQPFFRKERLKCIK